MWLLYRITCLVTGKRYIGLTKQGLSARLSQHHSAAVTKTRVGPFMGALAKYGKSAFSIEHVASASSIEGARETERALIAQENTLHPNGYNLTEGGEGTHGYTHTPEQIEKMKVRAKEVQNRPERRARQAEAIKGTVRSPEHRANQSRGIKLGYARRKANGTQKDHYSPERRKAYSDRMKGNKNTVGRRPTAAENAYRALMQKASRQARIEKVQPFLFETFTARRFERPLWWKEWL